ncbi:MAG: iron-dependent extradiol dioxygenase [Candidatus Tectimicrobiota bacterium]|nr:MAG: iron-dependent extradiol dioxygenase [Candidatus Tectomicrobia bacterium]
MVSVTQLGYLGLNVSDLAAWEQFATQILGLQVSEREDRALFLRMDEYHHRFVLHAQGDDDLAYIGWEVADETALEAMAAQLQAAGISVRRGTPAEALARRVAGLLVFADPNGVQTEVFYGPLMLYDVPFVSPRGVSGFVTGEQGLGHVVIAVDDFERSLRFYRDVLGMRLSDFVVRELKPDTTQKMAFFHCNPRHHSLAFMARPQAKRMWHFMLQTQSLNDVGITYDLCQDHGIPIVRGLGRHTNDHMVSFYMRTPSGFEVEYGWGGREVDDRTWQVQVHTRGSIWGHRSLQQPAAAPAGAATS